MLTWNVTYHCKSGQREAFYQALCDLGIRANSLKEEGNLKYDYFLAAEAPELVRRLVLVATAAGGELDHAGAPAGPLPDGDLRPSSGAESPVLRQRPNRQVQRLNGLGADEEFEKARL